MEQTLLTNTLRILGLAVLIVLGVLAIRFARRQAMEDSPIRPEDVLGPLEEAYHSGELDEAEYQRIRRSIEGGPADAPDEGVKPGPQPPPEPDLGETVPGA